jgi:ATP-dependent exoDNAse (exonuclease V) beta subunit
LPQLRLLELLTSGWLAGDGRTAFLVGDPMQSIYRFRKAEVGLFLKVQANGLGHVPLERLTLTANFRSQGGIVRWVNQTFTPLFPASNDADMGAITYSMAQDWHPVSQAQAVSWHLLEDEPATWDRVVALAQEAWQTHAQSRSPMAILVRSRSHLGELRRELVNAGLPCRAVELESLQSRSVVVDLLQLTRALVHRGDRVAWLAVLRAPWCGLTLGTLHALFANPAHAICDVIERCLSQASLIPSEIEPDQCSRLRATGAILLAGLRRDDNWPLVARIEATWRALQGPRLVKFDYELQDAQAFFDLVQSVSEFSDIDLDELEQQLAKLYAQPQTAGRAIDVMTMHKAKGLEFETVVLFGLGRKSKADTAPMLRIEQVSERVLFGPIKPKI